MEEPCKSTITTNEPCSPVFKEAQPRPSKQSISLISRIGIFIVHNVFLLLVIYCCNKASNRIVTRSKELVFYSWIPLSPEVSRLSPFTYAQQYTRTSRTFYTFAVHQPKPTTIITLHNMLPEGVGQTIREKGVHLELEKEVVGREGVTFITASSHAIEEETLSIPESLPDLLEEEESQLRSSLDSFEEFV